MNKVAKTEQVSIIYDIIMIKHNCRMFVDSCNTAKIISEIVVTNDRTPKFDFRTVVKNDRTPK